MRRIPCLLLLFAGCSTEEPAAAPADAGLPDRSFPEAGTPDGPLGPQDSSTPSDAGTDSGSTDVPCTSHDAGPSNCDWVKVSACATGGTGGTIAQLCGPNRKLARGWTCGGDEADIGDASLPNDAGAYESAPVNQCPDEGCSVDPLAVAWRCIECCPK